MTAPTSWQADPPFDFEDLSQFGKGAVARQETTDGDGAFLYTPMSLLNRADTPEIHGNCRPTRSTLLGLEEQGDLLAQFGLIVFSGPEIVSSSLDNLDAQVYLRLHCV